MGRTIGRVSVWVTDLYAHLLHFHGLYIRAFNGDMDPYAPIVITLCAGLRCNCDNHEAPNMVAGRFNLYRLTSTFALLNFLWMNPLDEIFFLWSILI